MSEDEDFVDFDEDEHLEDSEEQARRLEALRSSSSDNQNGSSANKGGPQKQLNPNAAAFVPKGPAIANVAAKPVAAAFSQSLKAAPINQNAWQGGHFAPHATSWGSQGGFPSWGTPPPMGTPTPWPQAAPTQVSATPASSSSGTALEKKRGWGKFTGGGLSHHEHVQTAQSAPPAGNPDAKKTKVAESDDRPVAPILPGVVPIQSAAIDAVKGGTNDEAATLVISRVPQHLNNMIKIAGYFSRFGEVTKVTLDLPKARSFVQFADLSSVNKALGHPQPVLNNKFIVLEKLIDHKDPAPLSADGAATSDSVAPGPTLSKEEIMKKFSYRMPHPVLSAAPAEAVSLYDDLDNKPMAEALSKQKSIKAIERAALKVRLSEKKLENAKAKLATLVEKTKGIREKLNDLSKQGKSVDPGAKAAVMAEMASLSSEIKTEQASVKAAEGNYVAAKKEYAELLAPSADPVVEATHPEGGHSEPSKSDGSQTVGLITPNSEGESAASTKTGSVQDVLVPGSVPGLVVVQQKDQSDGMAIQPPEE